MAIIFFALAFVLAIVAVFLIRSLRYKDHKNEGWERPSVR
jgi:hypothetical protein